jgi:hypothetical protein
MSELCQVRRSSRPVYGYAIAFRTSRSYEMLRQVTQWGLFSMRGTFTSTCIFGSEHSYLLTLAVLAGVVG